MRGTRGGVLAILMALALATPALAGLSPKYAGWADGPAGFLMTKQERKEWKKIDTDQEAERFIELFWARRDPNLDTPYNEFKAKFEGLVTYADEHFATKDRRGGLTDRGKVLILMGMPYSVERRGPTRSMETIDSNTGGTDQVWANAELWLYLPKDLPEGFKIKGSRLVFVFYETKAESNNFELDRTHREGTQGLRALAKAPRVWLVHPELTEPPKPVSISGASPASPEHLAWLSAGGALDHRAHVSSSIGVADAMHRPLWVHVELPMEAPELDLLVGRVLGADGSVESTFEKAATPLETGTGRAYQLSFPLLAGSYTVEIAGAAGGRPQVVTRIPVTIPQVSGEGAWLAGPWAGVRVIKEDRVMLGAPYRFGVLHLLPLVTGEVTRKDDISYFGFAGGLAGEHPSLRVKVTLARDGKRLGRPMAASLPVARLAEGLWVYASSLTLKGLPEPGDYELTLELKDPASGATTSATVPLHVTE